MKPRLVVAVLLLAGGASAQDYSSLPRVRAEALDESWLDGVSDEAVFQCACPSAVEFCREWAVRWAPQPGHSDDVRKCVIEMQLAIEEDQRDAKTFEQYEQMTDDEIEARAEELGL